MPFLSHPPGSTSFLFLITKWQCHILTSAKSSDWYFLGQMFRSNSICNVSIVFQFPWNTWDFSNFFQRAWFQDNSPRRHMSTFQASKLSESLVPQSERLAWAGVGGRLNVLLCGKRRTWGQVLATAAALFPSAVATAAANTSLPPSLTRHHPVTSLKGYSRSRSGLDVQTWAAGTHWWQWRLRLANEIDC